MAESTAYTVRVGERYPGRASFPEGAHLRLTDSGIEMVVSYERPASNEIRDIKSGLAQFGLYAGDHVLMLLFRFGASPWGEALWEAKRQRLEGFTPQLPGPGGGDALRVAVILLDGTTQLVRALRLASWSAEFVTAIRAAIHRQESTTGPDRAEQEINAWYSNGETHELAERAEVRCDSVR